MGVLLSALIFLYGCMSYVVSTGTTIAFSKNDVKSVTLYLNVLNPLETCAFVNISAPGVKTFKTRLELVEPKNVTVIELNRTEFEMTETGKTNKGILIQSNISEIIVIGLSTKGNSAAMFYARNATQIGTKYVTITLCEEHYFCQFAIIAREDDTVIEIILPEYFSGFVIFDGKEYGPGDVMNITLHESQTFQIHSTFDLSGVNILSKNENRFSVLSGSAFTRVQTSSNKDHLADMIPPLEVWGNQFILVRRHLTDYIHDEIRFVAAGSGANISIFGCGPVLNRSILGFRMFIYRMTCERVHIIANEPVLVVHFPVGIYHGDPAMFSPTPIHDYVSEYTVYIPPGFIECAVALIMETIHASTFDFTKYTDSFTDWNEVEHSVYSAAWLKNMKSGVVEITHTSPFGGHLVCDRDFAIIALTIGLGNVTLNEPQLYSPTTVTDSSTTQSIYETSISTERSESTPLSTSTNAPVTNVITTSQEEFSLSTRHCSCCRTMSFSNSSLPSAEVLREIVNKLKDTLKVHRKSTSVYLRTLTSVWDERPSSAGIGALGITVICVVIGSIVAMDLTTLMKKRR